MRGADALMIARQNGCSVSDVWLSFIINEPEYSYPMDPDNLLENGYLPEIHIYKKDRLWLLDLRCIYGLNVHIQEAQYDVTMSAIRRFKPKAIYTKDGEMK